MRTASILLVEDNALTRRAVVRAVVDQPWTVVEASDIRTALELLETMTPDVVLLDLLLPDGEGASLARRIRDHRTASSAPILALTGLLAPGSAIDPALFDGVLAKPIDTSSLVRQIAAHLPLSGGEPGRLGAGRRLIVADDDEGQRKLARFRFSKLGFEVVAVRDGAEALDAARARRPDVIMTDALMPRLDGFALCRAVRSDPELRSVPVVLVTSSYVEVADRELAAQAGASAYVVRTADLADAIAAVERVLSQGHGPSPRASSGSGEWESARSLRTVQQLERQIAHNVELTRQCSTLSAELSVLTTVAEALVDARDVERAMADVLSNCLDVLGTSRAAVCLFRRDGTVSVPVQVGLSVDAVEALAEVVARSDRDAVGDARGAVLALSSVLDEAALGRCGLGAGAITARLATRGEALGQLVVDLPRAAPESSPAFVGAVANQLSFALALARTFDQLSASEARARTIMENTADAIFAVRADGHIVDCNRAAERLTGCSRKQLGTQKLATLFVEESGGTPLGAQAERADGAPVARLLRTTAGRELAVETTAAAVELEGETVLLVVARDVSERNALAAQLRQSQKMDAMGRLAGGVAHDFNNLLTIILSYCDFAAGTLEGDHPTQGDLAEIRHASESAVHLTKQLLLFSRQLPHEPRWVDLNATLAAMGKMLGRILGEDVELSFSLAPSTGFVWIDPGSLEQVVMNLLVNARDAMPQGGRIEVRTAVSAPLDSRTEPTVTLTVRDTGVGMREAVVARIFEPFFSTKPAGKGTGLGLSTVFGIVQRAGGHVTVQSTVGEGSSFCVTFPRGDGEAPSSHSRATPRRRGHETILVVEDDGVVRSVVASTLRRVGYRVIEAPTAAAALDVVISAGEPIHLVLTDVVMPGMSGLELASKLHARSPAMLVLCMSGYTAESLERDPFYDASVAVLAKPIAPLALTEAVRDALDRPPAREASSSPRSPAPVG
jgi:PAS domain S-box-containing protein